MGLLKHRAQHAHQPRIEAIDPNRIAVCLVDMIVPAPARLDHQIAPLHHAFLAVGNRINTVAALDDEAHGRVGVTMRIDRLAGFDELDRHIQRMAGAFAHIGMNQADGAARALVISTDERTCCLEPSANLRPFPENRFAEWRRLPAHRLFARPEPAHEVFG